MARLRRLLGGFNALFRKGRVEQQLNDELRAFLETSTAAKTRAGMAPKDAARAARVEMGSLEAVKDRVRDVGWESLVEHTSRDMRYAVRMLRKTPGFTLVAVITLAVAIGVNTAIFSAVHSLLLKPLPYPEPDRLATLASPLRSPVAISGRTFLTIRDNATTADVAVSGPPMGGGVNLIAGDVASHVRQGRVSAAYFRVLGVKPFIGREFTDDADEAGSEPVVMLSHDIWARVFVSDPDILGRRVQLRGEPYTIVGVMPEGFTTGFVADVWTPLRPSTKGEGANANYLMIARLRPGVSWPQANTEVVQLGWPSENTSASKTATAGPVLLPLQEGRTSAIRRPLLLLWAAVGLVLLIACVNVAGLLIARSANRRRELATRMALGSGRRGVVRQLLVESAVLALVSGALGIGVGWLVLESLKSLGATVLPLTYPVEMDGRVLALTLVTALGTSVIFGVVPAVQASRIDIHTALAEGGTRAVTGANGWVRRLLVIGEVAMGVVVLVSAGLLVRTFVQLRSMDPGFDASGVITATTSLQDARYRDAEKVNQLFTQTLEHIRQLPGVDAAGVSLGLPYTRLLNLGFRPLDSASNIEPGSGGMTNLAYVTPGYFEALRIPVRRGRTFSHADSAAALPVAIVNEEFVSKYYRGQEMIGRRISTAGKDREVIAVVGNVRTRPSGFRDYTDPLVAPPIVYVPAAQTSAGFLNLVHTWFAPTWVVRTTDSLESAAASMRQAFAEVDPLLPIATLESMADVRSNALATQRLMMSLMVGLGLVALLLAAIGIHGLIASSVTERTRELGIRLALGATGGQAMRSVVLRGVQLAAVGVILGSAAAFATVRLFRAFLWGVPVTDTVTFGTVAVTLLTIALAASVIPALRILRLDPALTLRAE